MADLLDLLATLGVPYERCNHPPAHTVDDVARLVTLGGAPTKNLFLRDKKGTRQALVVVAAHKPVDLRSLAERVGFERPSFGSADRLKKFLGVEPGAVSLLALLNDTAHGVEVFIDRDIWSAASVQCHPLINTATLAIPHDGIERFLAATGHSHRLVDFSDAPARDTA
jgi:Ala-tRNA(Pro) deacylase